MPEPIKEWEKEFDKEFTISHPGDSGPGGNDPQEPVYEIFEGDPNEYKRFIRNLLTSQRQELVKKLEGIIKDEKGHWQTASVEMIALSQINGYNQALQDAINIIKQT